MTSHTARSMPPWLPGLLLLAALLWLMRDTALAMVAIWSRSETFTHAFLVPPIALWLAWRQRSVLAATPSVPVPWLLLPLAGACFAWLLGDLAAVGVVSQFALVCLIVLSVPALFGWAVARVLAFPLAFLFFAVPFGEFTQPVLMDWTADFTVAALRATGVPVYREGLNFVIPSGNWSVVEACSGVRYLIASFMVGTLFAYLNYRSTRRRLIFMGVAILVPVVANWLRAYMIVMIGHLSGNELAVGVDHLIYGWVFFGIVIGLMFFIGARWSEPEAESVKPTGQAAPARQAAWPVALAILAVVAGTQAWAWRLTHGEPAAIPQVVLPTPASPWQSGDSPMPWRPDYVNPSAVTEANYTGPTAPVWLWMAYFRDQSDERKLVTSVHSLAGDRKAGWQVLRQRGMGAAGPLPAVLAHDLQERVPLGAAAARELRVWRVYWTGNDWTASDVRAKVHQALGRLAGRPDDGAIVLMATPGGPDADATLAEFARLHLSDLETALQQTRDTR